MAPGRSSGFFRAATPTLFHSTCLAALLQDAPYPAWGPSLQLSSSVRDPGCQHPLRLGGLVFQLEMVGAEEVENQQPQGSEGEAGREQRVSRWSRWAGKGIQARHVVVA